MTRRFQIKAVIFVLALLSATWIYARSPSTTAPDATAPGPFQAETAEYKFPAEVDPDVLPGTATEIWARAFWPKDLSAGPFPLLVLLHGNHGTCGIGSAPRNDNDCSYTESGKCPGNYVVTPNHEGYSYLARHLASHGFIVVSINANRGITCGAGVDGDFGLNLARGRLILRHLQRLSQWNSLGGAPDSLGLGPNGLVEKIDFGQVGLFGHSRGGEGVRAAYNLYLDPQSPWPGRIPGMKVRGIFEIGAVDGQTARVLDADGTAWNQVLPMCDGDVSDLEGRMPFERMEDALPEKAGKHKSLYLVWGAIHNFFNTEWQVPDSESCYNHKPLFSPGDYRSSAQQKIALASVTAFFKAHVGKDLKRNFSENFNPLFLLPESVTRTTRVERGFAASAAEKDILRFEEFDKPTGTNSHGTPNDSGGIRIFHSPDHPARAQITWDHAGADVFFQSNWTEAGKGIDVSSLVTLDFRLSAQTSNPDPAKALDFSVELVSASGVASVPVAASEYVEILGPGNEMVPLYTVRIPFGDFGQFDLTQLRGVRFIFNRSARGALSLAQIRLSRTLSRKLKPETLGGSPVPITEAEKGPRVHHYQGRIDGFRKTLQGGEIQISSETFFPVQNSLPVLKIGDREFLVSRFPEGKTMRIVFSLSKADLRSLIGGVTVQVQYGRYAPRLIWDCGVLDSSIFN